MSVPVLRVRRGWMLLAISSVLVAALAVLPPMAQAVPARPPMVLRSEWGAYPPLFPMKRQTVVRLTIHHEGELVTDDVDVGEYMRHLQRFSQSPEKMPDGSIRKPWADIPYHFLIMRDGTIAQGRDYNFVGDTKTAYDPTGHVLVCLAGDLEKQPLPPAQYEATVRLCAYLCASLHISPDTIRGHRDYAVTDCPGKNMYARMSDLRRDVANALNAP